MGQRTLAFTRLLLREVSDNTLGNLGLLVVYTKQSCIQHIGKWQINSTPNMCQFLRSSPIEATYLGIEYHLLTRRCDTEKYNKA
jgi:hypothetical protein